CSGLSNSVASAAVGLSFGWNAYPSDFQGRTIHDGTVPTRRAGCLRAPCLRQAQVMDGAALAAVAARRRRDRGGRPVLRAGGVPAAAPDAGRVAAVAGTPDRGQRRAAAAEAGAGPGHG